MLQKIFLAKRDSLNQRTLCKRGHWAALGFPGGSVGKESTCNAGDPGLIPGLGRSPGGGQPTPVFLPGESHGHGNLAGYSLWGHRVGHDWSKWAHMHEPLWALSMILASPITDFLPTIWWHRVYLPHTNGLLSVISDLTQGPRKLSTQRKPQIISAASSVVLILSLDPVHYSHCLH